MNGARFKERSFRKRALPEKTESLKKFMFFCKIFVNLLRRSLSFKSSLLKKNSGL